MLKFMQVSKSFGEKTILNDISFEIEKASIVFILGTSGTGKSVLLKNIVGLLKPERGQIFVDGEDIVPLNEIELNRVRSLCGMVFQHPALFDSMSVFENVAYSLRRRTRMTDDEIEQRVLECLSLVQVRGVEHKLPAQISYGTQKRVSLARTIAGQPQILLFDEPTTGLDPITTNAVNQLIQDLSRRLKTTSLVVSHDMQCALDIADRIIVLDQGGIVEDGSPQELLDSEVPLVKDFLEEVKDT